VPADSWLFRLSALLALESDAISSPLSLSWEWGVLWAKRLAGQRLRAMQLSRPAGVSRGPIRLGRVIELAQHRRYQVRLQI